MMMSMALIPFLLLTGLALAMMLLAVFVKDATRLGYLTIAGLVGVGIVTVNYWAGQPAPAQLFNGAVTIDGFSLFFYLLFVIAGGVTTLLAMPYLQRDGSHHGEFYALLLFAVAGMFVMVSSNDLITLFLGFETMSLAIYVLVGWRRHAIRSNEAILKYYFLGSLAAAIFLYGIALIYGTAGTVNLVKVAAMLQQPVLAGSPLFVIGSLMVLVAVAFKVAAFPFHMWMPDVYEGAPAPVTAFMATAVKAAAFALVLRIFVTLFAVGDMHEIGLSVVWYLAIGTMFVGNVFAMAQQNIKRMLAYSSIAHSGYLLVGVAALPDVDAGAAIMVYLVAYAFTNLGALACVSYLVAKDETRTQIADFAGVAWRHPLVGLGMAICMFSLIGFPPTAGFFGKYYVLLAAVKAGLLPLVVIAILNSILSVYYYLRVVVVMYMQPADEIAAGGDMPPMATRLAILYTSLAVVWAGVGTTNLTAFLPGVSPLLTSARAAIEGMVADGKGFDKDMESSRPTSYR